MTDKAAGVSCKLMLMIFFASAAAAAADDTGIGCGTWPITWL